MKVNYTYVASALSLILGVACISLCLKNREYQREYGAMNQNKVYKALLVSYGDFAMARKTGQPAHNPLQSSAQDIRNYDVQLSRDQAKLKIRFRLISKPGQEILGGSAEYVVDMDTLTIDSKTFSM